jgi:hypothetical protein
MFGMFPKKGTIAVGLGRRHRHLRSQQGAHDQRQDAPHELRLQPVRGLKIKGYPDTVLSRGKVIIETTSNKAAGPRSSSSSAGSAMGVKE